MKRIKFLLPLIAIIFIAAGVFAMKANTNQTKTLDVQYWDYNGSAGGEATAASYSLGTSTPTHSTCGDAEVTVCQIQAEPDPSNPNQPNLNGQNPKDDQVTFHTSFRDNE